ncbi:MAG: sulfurtransferase-like selenium metabolism protein YedF [Desulfamplus sp.]|nr:sulfurtransferase-like selenium metabolism protein YedF [Desulfamplus sp.]
MSQILDARGLSCPAPVLMAKKAIESDSNLQEIIITVDNEASMENVSRFLTSREFSVTVSQDGSDFRIKGNSTKNDIDTLPETLQSNPPQSNISPSQTQISETHKQKIMVLAATDRMGFGDDDLGKKLMISFIKTIKEMGDELWRLVFVNNGVKLAIEGSPVIQELLEYESSGLKIMVCGTCLTHFNLMDSKRVGETTNMLDIVTAMQLADKVIKI